jgi:hypothetical protein
VAYFAGSEIAFLTTPGMLTDNEVTELKADPLYISVAGIGLGLFVDKILESGEDDLKPSVSNALKLISRLWRARTIRKELQDCTCALLERMMNRDLNWPRTPEEVKLVCDSHEAGYKWMRYDVPRVTAVFRRLYALLTDASFRNLAKKHCRMPEPEKNNALAELRCEVKLLQENVVRSIRTRGIFDDLTDLNAEEYYRRHEPDIQKKFLEGTQGGPLGLPEHHE